MNGQMMHQPLLIMRKKPDAEVPRDEHFASCDGKIPKWWTPDDAVFVDSIPLGATGKMLKHTLRDPFQDNLVQKA